MRVYDKEASANPPIKKRGRKNSGEFLILEKTPLFL